MHTVEQQSSSVSRLLAPICGPSVLVSIDNQSDMKSCNLQRSFFAMDFSCSSLCCCCCFCRPTNTVQIKSNSTTRSRDASRSWLLAVLSTQIQLRKNTMNDNQNVFHRGRSSSRVLAPPGGVCSITIGVAPAPPQPKAAGECPVLVYGACLWVVIM